MSKTSVDIEEGLTVGVNDLCRHIEEGLAVGVNDLC